MSTLNRLVCWGKPRSCIDQNQRWSLPLTGELVVTGLTLNSRGYLIRGLIHYKVFSLFWSVIFIVGTPGSWVLLTIGVITDTGVGGGGGGGWGRI